MAGDTRLFITHYVGDGDQEDFSICGREVMEMTDRSHEVNCKNCLRVLDARRKAKKEKPSMSKPDIVVTVKGKAGVGKSTIIRLIKIALDRANIQVVIDDTDGEDVVQHHFDNGEYSQRILSLRTVGTKVMLRQKDKSRKPPLEV